jgi:hypothetical protein
MDYDFRYSLMHLGASEDGSGMVYHDIEAQYAPEGTEDWVAVPGHHKTFCLPMAGVEGVMDMPDETGPQRQAKNAQYKDLLVECRNLQPVPYVMPPGGRWAPPELAVFMEEYEVALAEKQAINAECALQASRVNDYIVNVLGLTYPVPFRV